MKQFAQMKILVATRNEHKLREIGQILGQGVELLPVSAFEQIAEVVEDAATIEGNAEKKALEVARQMARMTEGREIDYVLADDTGLEVDALKGRPGVYSARYADDEKHPDEHIYAANNRKLLRELSEVKGRERAAQFKCVMALAKRNSLAGLFTGICRGVIIHQPKGEGGFGYDPLFVPEGYCQTFSQLGDDEKIKSATGRGHWSS
ncbi:non-canonical purine NTP pyrophosphatase [Geitlerinema calcuttense]|uniref:dITP/XTP pyrophosphatase n=1 Tax=Geitlerinema calcuttense NRMC-F 0142 TaxID=2922238 RepID=A0ABT7LY18_9CYAN|nr:non-canonical purine NTP pyrophosphatase [Geitlerinema calcuttense]MDL5056905.1 non-canonical purine NTP pyrophosphatase [Geitlerinema calcuttense NRMC-F 0142]